jgi:hypothetical protein
LAAAARIAAAVRAVDGVVRLDGGPHDEVATHLPGERIVGVRLHEHGGEVRVVVDARRPAHRVGEDARRAAERLAGHAMTVVVADIVVDEPFAWPRPETAAHPADPESETTR